MKRIFTFLMLALLLAGCGQTPDRESATDEASRRVEYANTGYITGYGTDSEGKLDDLGLYFPYTGGEMTFDLYLTAQGLQEEGVALMLFLDGLPQPFRVEGSGELVYQYMIYPKNGRDSGVSVSFTPVTGEAGEKLELCVLYFPSLYSPAEPEIMRGFYQERGVQFHMLRIKFEETPPEAELPPVRDRVVSQGSGYETMDLSGWLEENVAWNVYFNGSITNGQILRDFEAEDLLGMEFLIYGRSEDEFRLILYVNGEPVYVDGQIPTFRLDSDKKQTLLLALDCSDIRQEQIVFAMLLRRNYYGNTEPGWEFYPDTSDIRLVHIIPKED